MSGKRFSMGITQLPPQPRRASLLCNESVLPDSHFSSRTENPPAPPPRPAQVTRFSSGIAAVAASSFESQGGRHQQQLASKITLREELEQVQKAFYGNVGAPYDLSPAKRISLLEDQQNVLSRRAHEAIRETAATQKLCQQSVAAVEPLTALIEKDRCTLLTLTTRAFNLADTAREVKSVEQVKKLLSLFEMRIARAVLKSTCSSSTSRDQQEQQQNVTTPPFLTSFVALELFLTAGANFGSVAYCNWCLIKRKFLIDDTYYDMVDQLLVSGERTLDSVRNGNDAFAERVTLIDAVVAAPDGCLLCDLISIASARSK